MDKKRIIGLMSGTSLDGLDLVDVTIWERDKSLQFRINNATSISYSKDVQSKLKNCFEADKKTVQEVSNWYGAYLGNKVNQFLSDFTIENVDFVASHGHTVFHKPDQGITVQIGDGQILSAICHLEVICDFRTQDVKLGGQGAPLVPIGDQFLFSEYDYCLNLGGFANVSFDDNGIRKAYDICPVNIVLNHYTRKIGLEYDDGGELSRTGLINQQLLTELNELAFYSESYPKSLGYEFVAESIFPLIDRYEESIPNILRTFLEHVVHQISKSLQKKKSTVLITGGGAYNSYLIERIKQEAISEVKLPTREIIEFKEALIFALLGYLKKEGRINCLSSVTGAKRDHSSGEIFNPKK